MVLILKVEQNAIGEIPPLKHTPTIGWVVMKLDSIHGLQRISEPNDFEGLPYNLPFVDIIRYHLTKLKYTAFTLYLHNITF